MWLIEQALERLLGVKPAFMRPPYGNYNNLVRQVAAQRGQKLVTWDFDSGDSVGVSPAQSDKDYDALVKKHPSTILALNHEVYGQLYTPFRVISLGHGLMKTRYAETTAHIVVPHAIKALTGAGYKLVTVAECMGMQPYQSVTTPQQVSLPRLFSDTVSLICRTS